MQSSIVLLVVALATAGLLPDPVASISISSPLFQYTTSQISQAVSAMSASDANGLLAGNSPNEFTLWIYYL